MAYYYVKSGGTATVNGGRTTTQRTGTWSTTASEYYDSLSSLDYETDPLDGGGTKPVDGDIIFISNVHNYTGASLGANWNSDGSSAGAGLLIISVDDTNQEKYKPGANEHHTSNTEYQPANTVRLAGVNLSGSDETFICGSNVNFSIQDGTFDIGGGNGDHFLLSNYDGNIIRLKNVHVTTNSALEDIFSLTNGSWIFWDGGSITGTTSPDYFFSNIGSNGGADFQGIGIDMEDFTGDLFPARTAGSHENILVRFINCTINSSFSFPTPGTDLTQVFHRVEFLGCDDSTSNLTHRSWIGDGTGLAKTVDSVYNSNNTAWGEGSAKSSWKIETTSICSINDPFRFVLAEEYIDLTSTATDKIIVNLVTDAVLTDQKIAAYLYYPDGTSASIPKWASSPAWTEKTATTWGSSPLAADATTLSTSSLDASDWVGEPVSPNFYKLELDTSGAAGSAGVVRVLIEVYYDFTTDGDVLYIDSELELA